MTDEFILMGGVLAGAMIALLIVFFNSRKGRIDRLEKDVEDLKKKDISNENSILLLNNFSLKQDSEIASLKDTAAKLDKHLQESFKEQRDIIQQIVTSAIAPITVEIQHINKAIDDLKK